MPMTFFADALKSDYDAAVLQEDSNSESRGLIRNLFKRNLDQIHVNQTLPAEQKKAKSLELIQTFLQDVKNWAYYDVYNTETVKISTKRFTPSLILLANRLSDTTPLYLDEFLDGDESVSLEDLVTLGLYLESEIGLHVEKGTNRIVLNHGVAGSGSTRAAGISRPEPKANFVMIAHTHPTESRETRQFAVDKAKQTPGLELVITAGGVIVYFDRGVIHNNMIKKNSYRNELVLDRLPDGLSTGIRIKHPINVKLIGKIRRLEKAIADRAPKEAKPVSVEEQSFSSLFSF